MSKKAPGPAPGEYAGNHLMPQHRREPWANTPVRTGPLQGGKRHGANRARTLSDGQQISPCWRGAGSAAANCSRRGRRMGWASGFLRAPPFAVGAFHRFMVPSSSTALHALASSGTTRRSMGGSRRYGLHGGILAVPAAYKGGPVIPDLISGYSVRGTFAGLAVALC